MPTRSSLIAGLVLSIAILPVATHFSPAQAREKIDPVVTGSIGPDENTRTQTSQGSLAFRNALEVLVNGDAAKAYELAKSIPGDLERRTIQWAAIYFGNGAVDYASVARFAKDAPDFASDSTYKIRIEQALVKSDPSGATVIEQLGGSMPKTLPAQVLLAIAYNNDGQKSRAAHIARAIWVNNFLDPASEKQVLAKLGSLLTTRDHWARAERLLMYGRASSAERLVNLLTPAEQSLANATIAVEKGASNAKTFLARVDPSLRNHPLFYFAHAQQDVADGNLAGAVNYLDDPRGAIPYPGQWWNERASIVRAALAANNPRLAYRAAAEYTSGPEGDLVDARFQAGWIAGTFLGDPKLARVQFERMAKISTIPSSIAQCHYWLGRTLLKLGDTAQARRAFDVAAKYGTDYYGLLSRAALGRKGVQLRALPPWRGSQAAFDAHDLVQAVKLLHVNGQDAIAKPLLSHFANSLKDSGQLLLAARLAQTIDAQALTIRIANIANQRGTPLDLFSFPKDPLPPTMKLADIDKAAVYAVARQESRFKVDAVSGAGAKGLMQLMPGTAREVAAKVGVHYSPKKLTTDSAYNALLGSTYLASQLRRFDGSLLLAAAAYNAGASNASRWINAYGDPRAPNVDPVIWVELIPFEQTRDYVQRVLANYMVYRARMGDDSMTINDALRKIPN